MNSKRVTTIILLAMAASMTSCAENPKASPPTALAATLSNLHIFSHGNIEGDVTIENKGPNDTWIATGVKQGGDFGTFYPTQFTLYARDENRQVFTFTAPVPPNGATVGSATDMPMRQHAPQTIHVQWGARPTNMPAGTYQVYAEFNGTHEGFKCIPCWTGTVKSNEVQLTVP